VVKFTVDKSLIIDTDILIDVGREESLAIERLQIEEKKSILCISAITKMELIIGCQNKREINILEDFLLRFEIINISENISNGAISLLKKYRLSHGLLIADAIIAATVIVNNAYLLSKNQKDYRYIDELKLKLYP